MKNNGRNGWSKGIYHFNISKSDIGVSRSDINVRSNISVSVLTSDVSVSR